MPQARSGRSTRAVDSLSDSNPSVLEDNQTIVERADGSVWITTEEDRGFLPAPNEKVKRTRITERRVDSDGDKDHSSKGGEIWYRKLLKQQATRTAAAENKTSRKTPAPAKKTPAKTEEKS